MFTYRKGIYTSDPISFHDTRNIHNKYNICLFNKKVILVKKDKKSCGPTGTPKDYPWLILTSKATTTEIHF